jgi:predicted HTH transcriptional regulator
MGCILDRIAPDREPPEPRHLSGPEREQRLAAANRELVWEIRQQDRQLKALRDLITTGGEGRIPTAQRQQHIQALLAVNGPSTAAELAALMGVSPERVRQLTDDLVEIGAVCMRRAAGQATRYEVP